MSSHGITRTGYIIIGGAFGRFRQVAQVPDEKGHPLVVDIHEAIAKADDAMRAMSEWASDGFTSTQSQTNTQPNFWAISVSRFRLLQQAATMTMLTRLKKGSQMLSICS
jgi:hypothetical protein